MTFRPANMAYIGIHVCYRRRESERDIFPFSNTLSTFFLMNKDKISQIIMTKKRRNEKSRKKMKKLFMLYIIYHLWYSLLPFHYVKKREKNKPIKYELTGFSGLFISAEMSGGISSGGGRHWILPGTRHIFLTVLNISLTFSLKATFIVQVLYKFYCTCMYYFFKLTVSW